MGELGWTGSYKSSCWSRFFNPMNNELASIGSLQQRTIALILARLLQRSGEFAMTSAIVHRTESAQIACQSSSLAASIAPGRLSSRRWRLSEPDWRAGAERRCAIHRRLGRLA